MKAQEAGKGALHTGSSKQDLKRNKRDFSKKSSNKSNKMSSSHQSGTVLTHKLRSHTKSEQENEFKKIPVEEDRDSGTESDEENVELEQIEKQRDNSSRKKSRHWSGASTVSYSPSVSHCSDSDQESDKDTSDFEHHCSDLDHSSEEELALINLPGSDSTKRKWSQMICSKDDSSGSADEEIRDLFLGEQGPLVFSSSPPKGIAKIRSVTPRTFSFANVTPLELCASSVRKRHHRLSTLKRTTVIPRPCLDFEKMQQVLCDEAQSWKIEELICKRLKIEG